MQELSIPGNPVFDLGAVDILRARERGVPRYNAFRRQLGLKSVILRHYPELEASGLGNIKNAFEPWDTDAILSMDCHPLRA